MTANILWLAKTRAGGDIDAMMIVDGHGVERRLQVDAVVG